MVASQDDSSAGTVFVIDDDAAVRDSLRRLLAAVGWKAQSFGSAREFLDEFPTTSPGCILLDVTMPGMTGPQLHDQLRARGATYPVIYLTGQGSIAMGVMAMKAGASDFLEKPIDADLLLPAIEAAIDQHRQAGDAAESLAQLRGRVARLSVRERQVMDQVISGRLNKQIAADMGIAEKTVKVHRGRMMEKMEVRSLAQLVQTCDDLGIRQRRD